MKKSAFLWFLLVLLLACSEAPKVKPIPTERVVLAELFTWARCYYCPYAARALDSLAREYHDSLVIIAYHRRVGGDTLCPQYVENRKTFYYETGGEPAVLFDGTGPVWTTGPAQNYETYKTYIIGRRNHKSPLEMRLESQIQTNTGIIRTTVTQVDSINATDLHLFFVVCEDSVKFSLTGASDSVFNHVMRLMIPDENGFACTLALYDSLTKEVSFTLNQNWDRTKLTVISFLQDLATKEVLQSAVRKIGEK